LQFVEDGIVVAGLPVLVSDQLYTDALFWGIPKAHVMFLQRKGTSVERFPPVEREGTWVRAISRLGLAFLNETGVVRGAELLRTPCGRREHLTDFGGDGDEAGPFKAQPDGLGVYPHPPTTGQARCA
jgi:hypothetical protein